MNFTAFDKRLLNAATAAGSDGLPVTFNAMLSADGSALLAGILRDRLERARARIDAALDAADDWEDQ